ncbi:MAG: hypothetical protein AB8H79_22320 [Myxococcota bacterium]
MTKTHLFSSAGLLTLLCSVGLPTASFAFDGEVSRGSEIVRRDADSYRFRTAVDDALAAAPKATQAKVSFTPTDGGPAVASVSLTSPTHARAKFAGTLDVKLLEKTTFTFDLPKKVAFTVSADFAELEAGGGWVVAVDASGLKVRARLSDTGELDLVVFNEDREWDASTLKGVLVTQGDKSSSLTYSETRQRWDAPMAWGEKGPAIGKTYTASITFADSKGTTLDTLTDSFVVDRDASSPGVESIRVATTKKGNVRLVAITSSDGPGVTALEVSLTDSKTGKELIATTDDAPVGTQWHASAPVSFKSAPEGATYKVKATPLDANGKAMTGALNLSLPVATYTAESDSVSFEGDDLNTVAFAIVPAESETGLDYTFSGRWLGDYGDGKPPASWNIIFEEPFEGPRPLTSSIDLELDTVWSKWVQKSAAPLAEGSEAEVIATLTTAKGDVIDEVEVSGTEALYSSGDNANDVDVFIAALSTKPTSRLKRKKISKTRKMRY